MNVMLFNTKIHRLIFLFALALSLCALQYSTFALSVGLLTLAINWSLDGHWVDKVNRFSKRKSLWYFCLVYISIVIGVFYSQNFGYALKELRLWLPVLIIPIVLATSTPLSKNEFRFLLTLFCTSVFVATLISYGIYLSKYSLGSQNVREISHYISHIRFSLMIVLSIFILFYFSVQKIYFQNSYVRLVFIVVAIWMIYFLFVLQSITGISIFLATTFVIGIIWIVSIKDILAKFSLIVGVLVIFLLGISYIAHTVDRFFTRNYVDFTRLPQKTINNNVYVHDTLSRQYENGNLVWINVCDSELKREWGRASKISFDTLDKEGQHIDLTLIRYLTSKNLTKDSLGMSHLDTVDIALIENSVASVVYREHKTGLYPRLYQTLWEIDSYITRGAIGGSSIVQRIVYLKASWEIIKNNIIFGIGTGDGQDALKEYYKTSNIELDKKYWNISHNQYLTVWIASGIFGLILFLVGLIYPFILEKKYAIFLCAVFQLIILMSMLSEDTFETHVGVSFAALFYAILFFGYDFKHDKT